MQKILIYEYITGGGLINEDLTSDLMHEAKLMTNSLYRDCLKSKKISFKYFQDYRLNSIKKSNSVIVRDKKQIYDVRFLKKFDWILPILPESDSILYNYISFLEDNDCKKVSCNKKTILLLSDKLRFYEFCIKNEILTIPTYNSIFYKKLKRTGNYVVKDRFGAGCSYIKICNDIHNINPKNFTKKVIQPYFSGDDYSISVFFTKNNFKFLTINKQYIVEKDDRFLKLEKILVNVNPINLTKISYMLSKLKKLLPGLIGYIGIDIIIKNSNIYIVEINPRFTTSFIGLHESVGINLIDLFISPYSQKNTISGKKYLIRTHE